MTLLPGAANFDRVWDLLGPLRDALGAPRRLIHLPPDQTAVFVGDTHGDCEATHRVLQEFFNEEHVLVFLGDYVDRGPDSQGNLELLFRAKIERPQGIHLLMGNHEAWAVAPFQPADFWEEVRPQEEEALTRTLALLPLAAHHPAGVLALHGALPDVESLQDIERIALGSANWRKITWGDWLDGPGYSHGELLGRPTLGRDFFEEVAGRLGVRVLVRSHQPQAPLYLYGDQVLTLFTTRAYGPGPRRVALLPQGKRVRTARDLQLLEF